MVTLLNSNNLNKYDNVQARPQGRACIFAINKRKGLKYLVVLLNLVTFASMNKILIWTLMLCSVVLTSCDKLDDSDDGMVREILPGKWAFSYVIKSDEDPGLEFNYKQVIFNEDGTCALTYIDHEDEEGNPVWGALHGTYVASTTMIRITSSEFDGTEHILIWRITSLSASQVVVEYDFSMEGSSGMTAVVTLDKQ